ncbi:hypothetical protein ABZS98_09650 [Streptomyces avermitilis]|uniref:hypothetical protein n=1 Tax=Streptomyces avermitilis TaxID=33903 RepID=UPI0033BC9AE1
MLLALGFDDRTAIRRPPNLALHGYLSDAGELDRLDELFTTDIVYDSTYDITGFGQPPLRLRAADPGANHRPPGRVARSARRIRSSRGRHPRQRDVRGHRPAR